MNLLGKLKKLMAIITVNDTSYNGNSVVVSNGNVIIDGNNINVTDKVIKIHVDGNIDSLNADVCKSVLVTGHVKGNVKTMSGMVTCGPISGDVKTMSGNVNCSGSIGGKINTMSGKIKM